MDPKNPVESMARTYTSLFHNRADEYKEDYLIGKFRDFAVDGVVYHEGRTSPELSNVRYGLEVRLRRLTGLRAIVVCPPPTAACWTRMSSALWVIRFPSPFR